MRIAYLVPGNGGQFYCENCQRDGAQLTALRNAGHEVLAVPLYLPLGLELEGPTSPLFFGAVGFYLRESVPLLRSLPRWLRAWADSPAVLSMAAGQAGTTSARGREDLTLAMLRGDDPVFLDELQPVADWLKTHYRPDVVHLSNVLLIGLGAPLKRLLGVPVVVSLQDEHTWLDSCRPDKAAEAWEVVRRQASGVDRFLPVSRFYQDFMAPRLEVPHERFQVVSPGIDAANYPLRSEPRQRRIGFLSRWSEAMGLGILVDAFQRLHRNQEFADVGLLVCGGGTSDDEAFLNRCRKALEKDGLWSQVEFRSGFQPGDRVRFLADTTVLSVPSINNEAYGSFVLEALVSGVPVVQPRCGGFTELVEESGGGLLVPPADAQALADALAQLLSDAPRRSAMGATARDAVIQSRSLPAYAERLVQAYQGVLK